MSQIANTNITVFYFNIMLLFLFLYFLYKKLSFNRINVFKQDKINETIFIALDNYRLRSTFWSALRVILYFNCYLFPFAIIRIVSVDLYPLFLLSISNIIYIIILLSCLSLYFRILKELFFIDIIRLYLYYYTLSRQFQSLVYFIFSIRFVFTEHILPTIQLFLDYLTNYKQNSIYWNSVNKHLIPSSIKFAQWLYPRTPKILLNMFVFLNKYVITPLSLKSWYINVIFSELPTILFLGIALYNVSFNQLNNIIYSITMLLVLLRLYSKILQFFYNVELGDCSLGDFFYSGIYIKPVSFEEFCAVENKAKNGNKLTSAELNLTLMRLKCLEAIPNVEQWVNYVINDLQTTHVQLNGDKNSYKFVTKSVHRLWLLLFVNFSLVYAFFYKKLIIILYNYTLNNYIIGSTLIIASIILWSCTGYTCTKIDMAKQIEYHRYGSIFLHLAFWILGIICIGFAFLIYLNTNLYILFYDYVVNYTSLKVAILYTTKEKLDYLYFYLEKIYPLIKNSYITNPIITTSNFTKEILDKFFAMEYLVHILQTIKIDDMINNQITIDKIQDFCQSICNTHNQYILRDIEIRSLLQNTNFDEFKHNITLESFALLLTIFVLLLNVIDPSDLHKFLALTITGDFHKISMSILDHYLYGLLKKSYQHNLEIATLKLIYKGITKIITEFITNNYEKR